MPVEDVPLEYKRDVEEAISRLREVHVKEFNQTAVKAERDRLRIIGEYGELSGNIRSFRNRLESRNIAQVYAPRQQHIRQCLERAKAKSAGR